MDELQVEIQYINRLDTHTFARMLESPTQCYKFYWLEAIVNLLENGDVFSFEEIIREMLWEAWYTVSLYHLHLGPAVQGKCENFIEHAVHIIEHDSEVKFPMNRNLFMKLVEKNRKEINDDFGNLARNVPYRLLSPFLGLGGNDKTWNSFDGTITHIENVSKVKKLPYIILKGEGTEKKIVMDHDWKAFILKNRPVIISWIQMKKIRYLQARNPGVPGIVFKLEAADSVQRKMEHVRNLWKMYPSVSGHSVYDIYSGKQLNQNISLDHFIPWSYVTDDEIWNLIPTERSINSRKSNKLPEWDMYFSSLASVQYSMYCSIFSNEKMRNEFEACRNDNLNALWACESLYVPDQTEESFTDILKKNMNVLYDSASLQGYGTWKYEIRE